MSKDSTLQGKWDPFIYATNVCYDKPYVQSKKFCFPYNPHPIHIAKLKKLRSVIENLIIMKQKHARLEYYLHFKPYNVL